MRNSSIGMLCLALLIVALLPASSLAATAEAPAGTPANLTVGGLTGDGVAQGFGDVLVPIWGTKSDALFINPRFSVGDADSEEGNLGLVYRRLFADRNIILGGNIYYDSRWTSADNHFNQLGLGVEYLSEWVDARANYYLPENKEEVADTRTDQSVATSSGTHWDAPYARANEIRQDGYYARTTETTTYRFERFERAREGFDAEVGVKLPLANKLPDVKLFGGFYRWDSAYSDQDRIDGMKGRLEIHVRPSLYLDAQVFEDRDVYGAGWTVGGRLSMPFELGDISKGKNPFKGAFAKKEKPPFSSRLNEMVIRDMQVRMEESDWIENEAARKIETAVAKWNVSTTLLSSVTFVNGDNSTGIENGSFEHPYNTIQEGVDNAHSPVYVYKAANNYVENVKAPPGVTLIGEGCPLPANGGWVFGGNAFPTVDGASQGPSIAYNPGAGVAEIKGFRVINTLDASQPPQADPIMGYSGYERTGIYAGNVPDVRLSYDILEDCEIGGLLVSDGIANFSTLMDQCSVRGNTYGLVVDSFGAKGAFRNEVLDSDFDGNANLGLFVQASNHDTVDILHRGITTDPGSIGIEVVAGYSNGTINAMFDGIESSGDVIGMLAILQGEGDVNATLQNFQASGTSTVIGVQFIALSDTGDVNMTMSNIAVDGAVIGMQAIANAGGNINAVFQDFSAQDCTIGMQPVLTAVGNVQATAQRIDVDGCVLGLDLIVSALGTADATIQDISADNSTGNGVVAQVGGTQGCSLSLARITANDSLGDGVYALAVSPAGTVNISAEEITANGGSRYGVIVQCGGADAHADVQNIQANGNDSNGVYFVVSSPSGTATFSGSNIEANSNGFDGVFGGVMAQDDASLDMTGVTANGNGANGFEATVTSATANASITLDNITVNSNGGTGMLCKDYAALTATAIATNVTASYNGSRFGAAVGVQGGNSASASIYGRGAGNGGGFAMGAYVLTTNPVNATAWSDGPDGYFIALAVPAFGTLDDLIALFP